MAEARQAAHRAGPGGASTTGGPWVVLLVTASLAAAVAEVAAPAVLGRAVDLALTGGRRPPSPTGWLLAGLALIAVRVAADGLSELAGGHGAALVTGGLRRMLLRHAFDVGPSLGRRHTPGELCSRVVGNTVEGGRVTVAAGGLVRAIVPTVGGLVALALVDAWLLVTFAAGTGVVAAVVRTFFHESRRVATRYLVAQSAISARLLDALAGARTIGAAHTVDREIDRVLVPLADLRAEGRAAWRNLARGGWQGATLGPLVEVAVLAVAGLLLGSGRISPGELLAAGWYAAVGTGIGDAVGQVAHLARARAAAARVAEVLAVPAPGYGTEDLPTGPGGLELRAVTVEADGERPVDGLDLVVPAGRAVAVVGGSAAATSAVAAVAGRLRDPDAGEVLLDGVPLGRLSRRALRAAVTYAFDRPVLLGATVADAVAFGADAPGPDAVRAAARAACADRFIERLPQGYDTALARAPLSGGEAQRVGLARAFAHAGRLVILDDATSSLDTVTELEISRALTHELADRTRLIVAQRASTAARADLVAWLDRGRVRALAPHAALWDDPDYRAVFAADHQPTVAGAR